MTADLQQIWHREYEIVPQQLMCIRQIKRAAAAFNTNIDAVIKISGEHLAELAKEVNLTPADLLNPQTKLISPKDVLRGIIKCFTQGIAEEWLCEDKTVDKWIQTHIGCERLQMGGQAGIIANVMAALGVQEVYVHTAQHPQLQAKCFLDTDNLLAFDNDGTLKKAYDINRDGEEPLIHRIIEFAAGDSFELYGKKYTCPKSNRFIATYDTANLELKINDSFVQHLNRFGFDYLLLSGFHNLLSERGGLQRIDEIMPILQNWKKNNPLSVIHLELASTQDKIVRTLILEKLAPLADSLGLNEREALDALEICRPQMYDEIKNKKLTAPILFEILQTLKNKLCTPRIQLHFFGMYLTLQDKNFRTTPNQNKRGMMLASTIAAAKAGLGNIENPDNLLWAQGQNIGMQSAENLQTLALYLNAPKLAQTGITTVEDYDLIAVPAILVEKPLTLVGMGDTISSISLLGAR